MPLTALTADDVPEYYYRAIINAFMKTLPETETVVAKGKKVSAWESRKPKIFATTRPGDLKQILIDENLFHPDFPAEEIAREIFNRHAFTREHHAYRKAMEAYEQFRAAERDYKPEIVEKIKAEYIKIIPSLRIYKRDRHSDNTYIVKNIRNFMKENGIDILPAQNEDFFLRYLYLHNFTREEAAFADSAHQTFLEMKNSKRMKLRNASPDEIGGRWGDQTIGALVQSEFLDAASKVKSDIDDSALSGRKTKTGKPLPTAQIKKDFI